MQLLIILLVAALPIAAALALTPLWIRQARAHDRQREAQRRDLLIHDAAYQSSVDRERAHEITRERLAIERFKTLHLIPQGVYLINMPVDSVVAFPAFSSAGAQAVMPAAPVITEIPGPYDLLQELAGWRPSASAIFLARGAQGVVSAPMDRLWHIALTGPTGGGKTNILRAILPQLLYLGATCYLCDIHYAPIKGDQDWRPIAERLAMPPVRNVADIAALVEQLALGELQARIDRQYRGEPIGESTFLAIEELPAVMAERPEIAPLLGKLLRQGRQYGLCFIGATQDMLVKTLGTSSGVRECFRTGYYTGGDQTTARIILDLQKGQAINEDGLGDRGHVYLKTSMSVAQEVRVPFASNEAITALLPAFNQVSISPSIETHVETYSPRLDARSERIRELVKAKSSPRQIIEEVWGVSSGGGYNKAMKELSDIMATLL